MKPRNPSILVLSSGAVKGYVMLGALHYLFINDILKNVDHVIGTSVGSIMGFLLLLGISPVDILSYICTCNFDAKFSYNSVEWSNSFSKKGVFSFELISSQLQLIAKKHLNNDSPNLQQLFEHSGKKFTIVTYNLSRKQTLYINHETHPGLSCIEALQMSSNIPFVFNQYVYENDVYIDGAVTDGYAIEHANRVKQKHEVVLGLAITRNTKEKHIECTDSKSKSSDCNYNSKVQSNNKLVNNFRNNDDSKNNNAIGNEANNSIVKRVNSSGPNEIFLKNDKIDQTNQKNEQHISQPVQLKNKNNDQDNSSKKTKNHSEIQMKNQTINSTKNQIENQIENSTKNQMEPQTENQTANQTENQIETSSKLAKAVHMQLEKTETKRSTSKIFQKLLNVLQIEADIDQLNTFDFFFGHLRNCLSDMLDLLIKIIEIKEFELIKQIELKLMHDATFNHKIILLHIPLGTNSIVRPFQLNVTNKSKIDMFLHGHDYTKKWATKNFKVKFD